MKRVKCLFFVVFLFAVISCKHTTKYSVEFQVYDFENKCYMKYDDSSEGQVITGQEVESGMTAIMPKKYLIDKYDISWAYTSDMQDVGPRAMLQTPGAYTPFTSKTQVTSDIRVFAVYKSAGYSVKYWIWDGDMYAVDKTSTVHKGEDGVAHEKTIPNLEDPNGEWIGKWIVLEGSDFNPGVQEISSRGKELFSTSYDITKDLNVVACYIPKENMVKVRLNVWDGLNFTLISENGQPLGSGQEILAEVGGAYDPPHGDAKKQSGTGYLKNIQTWCRKKTPADLAPTGRIQTADNMGIIYKKNYDDDYPAVGGHDSTNHVQFAGANAGVLEEYFEGTGENRVLNLYAVQPVRRVYIYDRKDGYAPPGAQSGVYINAPHAPKTSSELGTTLSAKAECNYGDNFEIVSSDINTFFNCDAVNDTSNTYVGVCPTSYMVTSRDLNQTNGKSYVDADGELELLGGERFASLVADANDYHIYPLYKPVYRFASNGVLQLVVLDGCDTDDRFNLTVNNEVYVPANHTDWNPNAKTFQYAQKVKKGENDNNGTYIIMDVGQNEIEYDIKGRRESGIYPYQGTNGQLPVAFTNETGDESIILTGFSASGQIRIEEKKKNDFKYFFAYNVTDKAFTIFNCNISSPGTGIYELDLSSKSTEENIGELTVSGSFSAGSPGFVFAVYNGPGAGSVTVSKDAT